MFSDNFSSLETAERRFCCVAQCPAFSRSGNRYHVWCWSSLVLAVLAKASPVVAAPPYNPEPCLFLSVCVWVGEQMTNTLYSPMHLHLVVLPLICYAFDQGCCVHIHTPSGSPMPRCCAEGPCLVVYICSCVSANTHVFKVYFMFSNLILSLEKIYTCNIGIYIDIMGGSTKLVCYEKP